jgi:hypothetical protein
LGVTDAANIINVNNNVIINLGAKELGLAPEQLEKIVRAVISDKKASAPMTARVRLARHFSPVVYSLSRCAKLRSDSTSGDCWDGCR